MSSSRPSPPSATRPRARPAKRPMLTVLFDGVAYGMVLFILACGLAVTLGLMNLVNLAHGAFAMAGGYAAVVLVNHWGLPFLAALPLAFLAAAVLGLVLERLLYVHIYARSHFEQVLFSIGLVFIAIAVTDYLAGSQQVFVEVPAFLRTRFEVAGVSVGAYRLVIIFICGVVALLLHFALSHTR